MAGTARYYLARVSKVGDLGSERFAEAILRPTTYIHRRHHYTFTDVVQSEDSARSYIFGRLSKYEPQGQVGVVDPESHAERRDEVPNKLVASAAFVYLPEFSGVAFQHVWNTLERQQFMRIFPRLITAKYEDFLVNCFLEAISDLRTFIQRLSRFSRIASIQATVHPPNPLFGPAWRSLSAYIKRRRLGILQVREKSESKEGVDTRLNVIAREAMVAPTREQGSRVLEQAENEDIGDAAVLMAADGYGRARVEGTAGGRRLVVRTRETQVAFEYTREPDPASLYRIARERFARISGQSGLEGHE